MKNNFALLLFCLFPCSFALAQAQNSTAAQGASSGGSAAQNSSAPFYNLGLTFNLLGPLFGEYELGISTFVNPYLQVGGDVTYFSTQYISPEIQGWQVVGRANYYFSSFYRSGFYVGATTGFEAVSVKKNDNANWEEYEDLTWSVIPGYSWIVSQSFSLMLGLNYGYNLGENQVAPEIAGLYLF